MKDEAAVVKSEKRKGDVVRKVLLQWVRKKNNSPNKPQFDIPEVREVLIIIYEPYCVDYDS